MNRREFLASGLGTAACAVIGFPIITAKKASVITLDALPRPDSEDSYNGKYIRLCNYRGEWTTNIITGYDPTARCATVAWEVKP